MPTYEFYCEKCDVVFEHVSTVAERTNAVCPKCGATKPAVTQFFGTPIAVQKPLEPYFDHGLNRRINSWDHRKQVMKERGVEEIGNDRTYLDQRKEWLAQCKDKQKSKT